MDLGQLLPYIVLFVVFDLVVLGVVLLARNQSKKTQAAYAQAAAQRGWQLETEGERGLKYRFSGREAGVSWTCTGKVVRTGSSSSTGSSVRRSTVWQTPDVDAGGEGVVIGPRPPALPAQLNLGGNLIQMGLRAVLGQELAELIAEVQPVDVGGSALRDEFAVLATDQALAERLVVGEFEDALLQLRALLGKQPVPVVLLTREGLAVRLGTTLATIEQVDAMLAVGIAAVEALNADSIW